MSLVVAPCSHEAAKYAVLRWHYSAAMPASKLVKYGVWESDVFVGAIIFSRGASAPMTVSMRNRYGLEPDEWSELTRVAMTEHTAPVSQAVAEALRLLHASNPGLRLVVSFADPTRGHRGGIYQAGNWIYTGTSGSKYEYWLDGRWRQERTIRAAFRPEQAALLAKRPVLGKYRYLYPLDRSMRRRVAREALPYPGYAGEGSTESRQASGLEGQVRTLAPAPAK